MTYALQGHKNARKDAATDYFRANPHRIHLGHVGFRIKLENGTIATPEDVREVTQTPLTIKFLTQINTPHSQSSCTPTTTRKTSKKH